MLDFLKCVAEVVVEKGVRGLAQMVPYGAGARPKYRDRKAAEREPSAAGRAEPPTPLP